MLFSNKESVLYLMKQTTAIMTSGRNTSPNNMHARTNRLKYDVGCVSETRDTFNDFNLQIVSNYKLQIRCFPALTGFFFK